MIATAIIIVTATAANARLQDERAYQRAVEQRNPARCVEIQNADLRQQCRVELGAGPENCIIISDPEKRAMCQARAR